MKQISWEKFNKEQESGEDEYNDLDSQPMGEILYAAYPGAGGHNSYEDFNLFICHCNFRVTIGQSKEMCETEGVESIDLLSPYRFRVSAGKMFEPQKVLDLIEELLTKE